MSRLLILFAVFSLGACSRLPLSSGEKIERLFGARPRAVRPEQKIFRAQWIKNHDPVHSTGNLPIGIHGPLVHQGVVYAGDDNGWMRAYELTSGRELWSVEDRSTYHSAPIAYQDQLIYGTAQGRLISRHQVTGELKYEVDLGASVESRASVSSGRLLVQLRNHQLFCLDAETGKILWAYRRSVPYQTTLQRASTPLIIDQRVFVGFADGSAAAFSLEDGLLLWEGQIASGQKFVDADTDPVLFMQQLLMGAGGSNYALLDPQSGAVQYQLPYITNREALIVDENRLMLGTVDGKVVLLNRELRELASQEVRGSVTSMVRWGGHLVVATTAGRLYALSADDLSLKEEYFLGHSHSAVFGRMQVEGDSLVLLSSRNRLYSFGLN